jgi:hypothetical protein
LNAKLDDTLVSLDFWRTPLEHAIYIQRNVYVQLVVEVYVDNLVIIGSGRDDIKWFKEEMMATFKMSELRLRHYYLDIEVKQSASGISPSQGVYAMKILERYDMARCNPYHVRIEARFKLSKRNTHATVGECYSIPEHH